VCRQHVHAFAEFCLSSADAFSARVARAISSATPAGSQPACPKNQETKNKKQETRNNMSANRALRSSSTGDNAPQLVALSVPRLTDEQLECLRRCARGISLRFDVPEMVDAIVAGGYAREGVARVVTITAAGLHYLQTHSD
jgi:hypothetical protein